MHSYQNLPAPPNDCTAANVLARLVDSLGYRFYLATNGLSEKEADFRPVEGSMNIRELLDHMHKVLFFAYQAFYSDASFRKGMHSLEEYREGILELAHDFSGRLKEITEEELAASQVYLKRTDTHYSFWYLINGPIGDVLTHIGQINSWRRMAGNPVERTSPFTGEPF